MTNTLFARGIARAVPWRFFSLAYAISWFLWGLALLHAFGGTSVPGAQLLPYVGAFGPCIAAIVCTGVEGSAAMGLLLRGMLAAHQNWVWYVVALLLMPACMMLANVFSGRPMMNAGRSPARHPKWGFGQHRDRTQLTRLIQVNIGNPDLPFREARMTTSVHVSIRSLPTAIIAAISRVASPSLSGWGSSTAAPSSFLSHIRPVLGRSRAHFQRWSILLRPQKPTRLQKRWPRKTLGRTEIRAL